MNLDAPFPAEQTTVLVLGMLSSTLLLPYAQAGPVLRQDVEPCVHLGAVWLELVDGSPLFVVCPFGDLSCLGGAMLRIGAGGPHQVNDSGRTRQPPGARWIFEFVAADPQR